MLSRSVSSGVSQGRPLPPPVAAQAGSQMATSTYASSARPAHWRPEMLFLGIMIALRLRGEIAGGAVALDGDDLFDPPSFRRWRNEHGKIDRMRDRGLHLWGATNGAQHL